MSPRPYVRQSAARARAARGPRWSTITAARTGGWYAVDPVVVREDGRRDRLLHGTSGAPRWISDELAAIAALPTPTTADRDAEQALRWLLRSGTAAEIDAEVRAAERAEQRRLDEEIEAEEEAEEQERRRERAEAVARREAVAPRVAEIRAEIAAQRAEGVLTELREAEYELEIATLEGQSYERLEELRGEIEHHHAAERALAARRAREAAAIAQQRADLYQRFADLRPGSVVHLRGHREPRVITAFDPETLAVSVETAYGVRQYDLQTGARVDRREEVRSESV